MLNWGEELSWGDTSLGACWGTTNSTSGGGVVGSMRVAGVEIRTLDTRTAVRTSGSIGDG